LAVKKRPSQITEDMQEIPLTAKGKPMSLPQMWIRDHMTAFIIFCSAIVIAGIFFGIRYYHNANHPLTKLMKASAKDFNTSFSFHIEARKNGEAIMIYDGVYKGEPSKQKVQAIYDADYGSYTYTGAVYAQGDTRIRGSLYDGKWRIRRCSSKIADFFDFCASARRGKFNSSAFLSFAELSADYSGEELDKFGKTFKQRMASGSELASLEITSDSGGKTYAYEIDLEEFFDLVREKGASVFYNVTDYNDFCDLYDLNEQNIGESGCTLRYTISKSGYLTDFYFAMTAGGDSYELICEMDDFGSAEVDIPDEFFDAEVADD